jgi:hypothetical protein
MWLLVLALAGITGWSAAVAIHSSIAPVEEVE